MIKKKAVTGIILCGGKSRRMGKNKALLKLKEKYIISYVVDILSGFCNKLILSSNSSDLKFLKIPVVEDEHKNIGPIAGIIAGLKASENQINIVFSCDTPFITSGFVEYMLSKADSVDVLLPVFDGFLQPMTGIFDKKIIPLIENEISKGNFVPPRIFEKANLRKLDINEQTPGYHRHLFFNINSPDDYRKAQKIVISRY